MVFAYLLVHGADLPPGADWREVEPAYARFELHDALRDPFVRFDCVRQEAVDHFDGEVDRVLAQLVNGRARLFKRPTPRPHADVHTGAAAHSEDPEEVPLLSALAPSESSEPSTNSDPPRPTWIEINVVDIDDAPIHDHAFRLRLSDGSIREGKLGADGRIRFDDVVAGLCTLILPTNDENEWDPAHAS